MVQRPEDKNYCDEIGAKLLRTFSDEERAFELFQSNERHAQW